MLIGAPYAGSAALGRARGRTARCMVAARGVAPVVGVDEGADQPVPDDVDRGQLGEVDVVDAVEDVAHVRRLPQTDVVRSAGRPG